MAVNFKITNNVAKALANAFATQADGGSGALIRIYDGAQPTDADTAIGAQVKLAELAMSGTAFGAATDANPGGLITAAAITNDSSADATGTAAWFRIVDQNAGNTICDGSVGTSSADLILNTVAITAGSVVAITSMTVTMPES